MGIPIDRSKLDSLKFDRYFGADDDATAPSRI